MIGIVIAGALAAYLNMCPCSRLPGAWLLGDRAETAISDWSFSNDREAAPLCQIQIDTWRPHSINLNCMSTENDLFVSCSNCAGKNWSQNALTHPEGFIRTAGTVYPVTLTRMTEEEKLDGIWQARLKKVATDSDRSRPDHWWSFQLTSR